MTGELVVAAALAELIGSEATGPFAPLVAGHALAALAVGGLMMVGGIGISAFGGYLIYSGITGKVPDLFNHHH